MPAVFIADGEVDYANPYDPLDGEDITDAVVTVTNEDTGEDLVLDWYDDPSGSMERGSYGNYQQDFPHAAGESISMTIEVSGQTITGGPTETPDSWVEITSPTHGSTVSYPIEVEWTVTEGDHPATHTFVFINADDNSMAFMDVVPLDDGSYTIEDTDIDTTGPHHVTVWPTNVMAFDGRVADGSANHVKTTELSYSAGITIE